MILICEGPLGLGLGGVDFEMTHALALALACS